MDLLSINHGMFFWTLLVFLLLVLVLGKFAWKPMLQAIDDREKGIKKATDDAEAAKDAAEKLLAEHKQLIADSEEKASELLRNAKAMADKQAADAKEKAQATARLMVENAEREINAQKDAALKSLKEEVATIAIAAAGKIINQNLDEAKHKTLVDEYLTNLPKN
jgi:F-type H+-transporting ATPase subunit b